MARGRFVNRKITVSDKFQALPDDTCRLMATWIIPHLDKQGVWYARPAIVKSHIFTLREDVTFDQVDRYLQAMHDVRLIVLFDGGDGKQYQFWPGFEEEQPNLRPDREATDMPAPPSEDECQALWGDVESRANDGQSPGSIPAVDSQKPGYIKSKEVILKEIESEDKSNGAASEPEPAEVNPKVGASQPPPTTMRTITQEEIRHPDAAFVSAWSDLQEEILGQMQQATYDEYIRHIRPVCVKDECAVFVTDREHVAQWCNGRLKIPLQRTLCHALSGVSEFSVAYQPGGT